MTLQFVAEGMVRRDWGRDYGPEYLGTYHGPTPGECVISCLSWLQVVVATNSPLSGAWIAQRQLERQSTQECSTRRRIPSKAYPGTTLATQAVERRRKARYRLHDAPEGHAASSYQKL